MSFHRFYRFSTSLFSKIFGRPSNLKKYFEYVKNNLPMEICMKIHRKGIFIFTLQNSKNSSLSMSTDQVLTAETRVNKSLSKCFPSRIVEIMTKKNLESQI